VFRGFDASNNNGHVDFAAAQLLGLTFCYAKATEGAAYVDGFYDEFRLAARAHGMRFGAYHFAKPGQSDGRTQAKQFLLHAQVRRGDLLPVLDFEVDDGIHSTRQLIQFVKDFSDEVLRQLGARPILYTFPSFRPDVLPYCGYDALWLACSASKTKMLPARWNHWVLWQNADHTVNVGGKGLDFNQAPSLDAITYLGRVPHPVPPKRPVPPKPTPAPKPLDPRVVVVGPKGGAITAGPATAVARLLPALIVRFGSVTIRKH